jgi:hypothetical protein
MFKNRWVDGRHHVFRKNPEITSAITTSSWSLY